MTQPPIALPPDSAARPPLQIVIVGHVDHGKSTLIGRLLHDTGCLPDGKLEELQAVSARRGMPLEWSFVLDSFQAERDQAVTIDTTRVWFRTAVREVVIIDAPGHQEFLKNMISGAASADAAVLVVDAGEGMRGQTRRHAYLLRLLGIRQVAVAVNKMDLVGFSPERFADVAAEVATYLDGLGIAPAAVIPVSARGGDGVAAVSPLTPWYQGPSVLEALDRFHAAPSPTGRPLRLPIQDVYKFDERRILVGRIESGTLRVGDTLLFSPSDRRARVRSIEQWPERPGGSPVEAHAGQPVAITLDEPIFVERGDVASHEQHPPLLSPVFRATLFWLARRPLEPGMALKLKLGTREAMVTVQAVERVIDAGTLDGAAPGRLVMNGVGEVVLRSRSLLALDEYHVLPATGRCVLVDGFDTVAGGTISLDGYPDCRPARAVKATNLTAVAHHIDGRSRSARNGHRGGVVWLTGLSGSGKSTLAMALEQHLFARGWQVYVLDGDNVRRGLTRDLGFGPQDRAENIRRVGEVAALFADAGILCITAFISPYQDGRAQARAAADAAGVPFHEVHVKAGLEVCEARDPKGLYARARAGQIADFTGISAPYEEPASPELVVDTTGRDAGDSVDALTAHVLRYFTVSGSSS